MTSDRRRQEQAEAFERGKAAWHEGKSQHSSPYGQYDSCRNYWLSGWQQQQEQQEEREAAEQAQQASDELDERIRRIVREEIEKYRAPGQ